MHRLLPVISALALAGCAASRVYFQPTEHVRGTTDQGFREAIYPLVGPHGPFGEAKVWSRGAYRGPGNRTVIHLGIEIHNTSAAPIVLDARDVRLDPVRTDDGALPNLAPAEQEILSVPPAAIAQARFHFVLPASTSPGDVYAFRARWRVTSSGQTYSQYTPFIERYGHYAYAPGYYGGYYYYYCDPFDPWCFGPGPYYYPYGGFHGAVIIHGGGYRGPRGVVHRR
jgi:hypothetical protein